MDNVSIHLDNHTFISAKEVLKRVHRSKAWLYKQISNNTFPRPVKIGTRAISFIESEVDLWIKEQISSSRGGINN